MAMQSLGSKSAPVMVLSLCEPLITIPSVTYLLLPNKDWRFGGYLDWTNIIMLFYFLLLLRAQESYSLVKRTYGDSNCFMLQVNSIPLSVSPSKFTSGSDLWSNMTTSVMGQVCTTYKTSVGRGRAT